MRRPPARLIAARVLERVERARAFADLTLQAAFSRSPLGARDRAFATELVYGTLRWRGRIDFRSQVLDRRSRVEAPC
jgi:16S rRNA (cytosine967-C5)-methyltransferase